MISLTTLIVFSHAFTQHLTTTKYENFPGGGDVMPDHNSGTP